MPTDGRTLAKQYRETHRVYVLDWRSTGEQHVTGLAEVASILQLASNTVRVYCSIGRSLTRTNPATGALDLVTVAIAPDQERLVAKQARAGRPRVVRPAKATDPEDAPYDWAASRARNKPKA